MGYTGSASVTGHRTCATSTPGAVLGSGGFESGAGLVPTKPGRRKSNGETLLDALMPPQPVMKSVRIKEKAAIAIFRFNIGGEAYI